MVPGLGEPFTAPSETYGDMLTGELPPLIGGWMTNNPQRANAHL